MVAGILFSIRRSVRRIIGCAPDPAAKLISQPAITVASPRALKVNNGACAIGSSSYKIEAGELPIPLGVAGHCQAILSALLLRVRDQAHQIE